MQFSSFVVYSKQNLDPQKTIVFTFRFCFFIFYFSFLFLYYKKWRDHCGPPHTDLRSSRKGDADGQLALHPPRKGPGLGVCFRAKLQVVPHHLRTFPRFLLAQTFQLRTTTTAWTLKIISEKFSEPSSWSEPLKTVASRRHFVLMVENKQLRCRYRMNTYPWYAAR